MPSTHRTRNDDLRWISRFRVSVARNIETLCSVVGEECGKPPFETLTSEITPLLNAARWTEKRATRILRTRRIAGGGIWPIGQRHRVARVPLGDVAIIATWNYPLTLLGVQLIHAIAGGNRVWVKPSEKTPRSQGMLLDLAHACAPDPSRLTLVEPDREAGERLLQDHRFDHVVFTGSTEVGRSIASTLAASLTPSTLELSGSDSVIVQPDADLGLAARSVAFALHLNGGQTCMAPRRLFIPEHLLDRFTDQLRTAFHTLGTGTPTRPEELERTRNAAQEAVNAGGRWLHGENGTPPYLVVTEAPSPGTPPSALYAGEHFGPGMVIVPVQTPEEAVTHHRLIPKKLATAVFTRRTGEAERLAGDLGSTIVTINDCLLPTGHPGMGLGGIASSGWGVTQGEAGLLAMTRPVFVSRTGQRVRTPLTLPSARGQRFLAAIARRMYG